jgi:uncharacterized repeat protein (TIGR03803 family)
MKIREFGHALSIGAAAAFLAACVGSQTPIGVPGATQASAVVRAPASVHRILPVSSTYKVLYSFTGHSDGAHPQGALLDVHGTLYGTTMEGGGSGCTRHVGCGTVYTITTAGAEKVLFSFDKFDGAYPYAGLIKVNGTLYGTTSRGGTGEACGGNCGTVYSITTTGTEKVLLDFDGHPYGAFPYARLKDVKGTLYGTTQQGGLRHGPGTVYRITTAGVFKRLFAFDRTDGAYPNAGLIDVNGTLYGTTEIGGDYSNRYYCGLGCGTVFAITPSGKEKVLHSFGNGKDGTYPLSGLVEVNGTLYGTTAYGGSGPCDRYLVGCGTVFSITPGGKEKVLHNFAGTASDGEGPFAGLTNVGGTLYGTTYRGGAYGDGTVFSITLSGHETVLYSFMGGQDGAGPQSGLNYVNGTLYGTTYSGGGNGCKAGYGCGTVYSITP